MVSNNWVRDDLPGVAVVSGAASGELLSPFSSVQDKII